MRRTGRQNERHIEKQTYGDRQKGREKEQATERARFERPASLFHSSVSSLRSMTAQVPALWTRSGAKAAAIASGCGKAVPAGSVSSVPRPPTHSEPHWKGVISSRGRAGAGEFVLAPPRETCANFSWGGNKGAGKWFCLSVREKEDMRVKNEGE